MEKKPNREEEESSKSYTIEDFSRDLRKQLADYGISANEEAVRQEVLERIKGYQVTFFKKIKTPETDKSKDEPKD